MSSIVIKVSALYAKACLLKNDKMSYVELTIDDEDPECISFSAMSSKHPYEAVDYEEIEAVPSDICDFN